MVQKGSLLQHLILLNFGILCISTSGVLGRSIDLSPFQTIFWRSLIAFGCLAFFCLIKKKQLVSLFKKSPFALFFSGLLMGLHWVSYFFALKWSSVAIGMLSLYTFPIFTAFLEPLFSPERFQKKHLVLGLALLVGIYLISPPINWENQQFLAVGMGIFSALCFAFRNLLIKQISQKEDGTSLMTTQVFIVSLVLLPFNTTGQGEQLLANIPVLFFLALITTVVGHSLFLHSFQKFSITTASLISCLQPLYGILMGAFLLGEIPQLKTLLGGSLILVAVGFEMFSLKKK